MTPTLVRLHWKNSHVSNGIGLMSLTGAIGFARPWVVFKCDIVVVVDDWCVVFCCVV